MVSRRAMAILGGTGLGLLALIGVATAKPKGNGGSGTVEDPYSPEACEAYKSERASINAACNGIRAEIYSLDAQRLEAAANEQWDLVAQLDAARAGLNGQLGDCMARVNQLDNLISQCG